MTTVPEEPFQLKPKVNEKFDYEPMPDGCLLYHQENGRILTVNPTAELILSYCDGSKTLEEVYQQVEPDAGIPRDVFLQAIEEFLNEQVLISE